MRLISCARCGKIHPWGQCPIPKAPQKNGIRTDVQRFRSSARWQRKAEQIRQRDLHMCKMCLAEGRVNTHDLSVHHIIPIMKDESRSLDDSNLITLCRKHHDMVEDDDRYTVELLRLAGIPPGQLLRKRTGSVDRTAPLKKQTFP